MLLVSNVSYSLNTCRGGVPTYHFIYCVSLYYPVHATGVVVETGKKFWSTKDVGQEAFQYQAGVGSVIKGWDKGCY